MAADNTNVGASSAGSASGGATGGGQPGGATTAQNSALKTSGPAQTVPVTKATAPQQVDSRPTKGPAPRSEASEQQSPQKSQAKQEPGTTGARLPLPEMEAARKDVKVPVLGSVQDDVRKDLIRYHGNDKKILDKLSPLVSESAESKRRILSEMTVKMTDPNLKEGRLAYARELQRVAPDVFKRAASADIVATLRSETKVDTMIAKANAQPTPYAIGKAAASESRARSFAANPTVAANMALQGALAKSATAPKAAATADQPRAARGRGM